jgi:hypothetical protein
VDAEDLYRLAPEDFTAARDAAAKQARADGDREAAAALKALRRPTVSAWLLNHLVHAEPELVEQLLQLGPGLAQAQAGRDAAALRTLGEQRRQLVGAVVGRAVELAGRPVAAAVRDEVASTLEAGLADAGSADAVRTGRLVRALSYAGFGEVDLVDAVAPPSPATTTPEPARTKPDLQAKRLAEAEAAALDAAGRLDDAVRACRDAERQHDATSRAEQEVAREVERLTQVLAEARARHDAAAAEAFSAAKAARKAAAKVERAQDRAEQARDALDALRRGEQR